MKLTILLCFISNFILFGQKSFEINNTNYLPPMRFQDESDNICFGYSLIYNLMSYSVSKSNGKSVVFSPCYNYTPEQRKEGIDVQTLIRSIKDKGLLEISNVSGDICNNTLPPKEDTLIKDYFLSRIVGGSSQIVEKIKKNLSDEGLGLVFAYRQPVSKNIDFYSGDIHYMKFKSGTSNSYNHAVFCLGYNDALKVEDYIGAFLVRDTDKRGGKNTKKGELWIPYKEITQLGDDLTVYNLSKSKMHADITPDKYAYGKTEERPYWLGKPKGFFKKKKYYVERYSEFDVVVLTLQYFGKKAKIGIKNKVNSNVILEFNLKPKESYEFLYNNKWYKFTYLNKSFCQGKMWWYPEINYSINN